MKRLILFASMILLGSCNQLNTITEFDGTTYNVHTYSTGIWNVPKQAFDIECTTTDPNKVDSLKVEQTRIGVSFIKNY